MNRLSCGAATLFRTCQAMSIAITTVLPAPVAIFSASRGSPSLCSPLASSSALRIHTSVSRAATSDR